MDFGVGDSVYILYWRKFPLPGNDANGSWESAPARVVSRGKKSICVEVNNASVMDDTTPQGSTIRFVDVESVFSDHVRAELETKNRRPPTVG